MSDCARAFLSSEVLLHLLYFLHLVHDHPKKLAHPKCLNKTADRQSVRYSQVWAVPCKCPACGQLWLHTRLARISTRLSHILGRWTRRTNSHRQWSFSPFEFWWIIVIWTYVSRPLGGWVVEHFNMESQVSILMAEHSAEEVSSKQIRARQSAQHKGTTILHHQQPLPHPPTESPSDVWDARK